MMSNTHASGHLTARCQSMRNEAKFYNYLEACSYPRALALKNAKAIFKAFLTF